MLSRMSARRYLDVRLYDIRLQEHISDDSFLAGGTEHKDIVLDTVHDMTVRRAIMFRPG